LPLHRLVVLPAVAVVLAACGGAGPPEDDAAPVERFVAVGSVDDELPKRRVVPTTTTTVAPTTTTTTPPPPPPPTTAPPPPSPPPAPAVVVAAAPAPPPASSASEGRALQLINGERASAGLAPLRMSGGATSVGRAWSAQMAQSGLAHNPDLSGDLARAGITGWRTMGENVGYGGSVDQVHGMFMGSSGHRANILKAAYSEVGIGVVQSGGQVWVTLDFVGY